MCSGMCTVSSMEMLVSVRLQVAESFMELIHKHTIVGLSKVFVRVAAELIISVNHSTDSLHDPLSLINWAHNVLVSVENGDRDLINSGDRNVGSDPALIALSVLG